MIWYMVIWGTFSCPGGWLASKALPLLPDAIQVLVCRKSGDFEILSNKKAAYQLVQEKGPGARLFWCKNLRRWEKEIKWSQVMEVK